MKLTLAVYRVTALFPAGEDLGLKIRESADKILSDFLLNQFENTSRTVAEILGFFNLAERKNWVDPRNFSVLKREYASYLNSTESSYKNGKNNHRQEKILEAMNGNGIVKIGELVSLFPELNRRTVLRDLDKLCQTGVMVRSGNGRGAYYAKNGHKCDIAQQVS